MLAARGFRRLAAAVWLARRSVSALPSAGAARFHDYDAAVTECVERRALREGRQVHARIVAEGYRPALYLATRLVIMYARCGALEDARNLLDGMPERNVVSWTAMISGYSQNERPAEAMELFVTMLRAGCEPNGFTLASVLTSCTGSQDIHQVKQVHAFAVKTNFELHMFVGSALLDMYAKSENIREARRVFDMLPARDVVSYTAIISGYTQQGLDEDALDFFRQLYNEGMQCNQVTFTALLYAMVFTEHTERN